MEHDDDTDEVMDEETPKKKPVRVTRVNYTKPDPEEPVAPPEKKKIEPVITGKVIQKKKSFARKLKETFTQDDAQDVGTYVIFEVLVPAAKKTMQEMVAEALNRIFWGATGTRRPSVNRQPDYTSYNRYYNMAQERRVVPAVREERAYQAPSRRMQDFDDIILETRADADEVLDGLRDLIETFGVATVSDLYELIGDDKAPYTSRKYGWMSTRDMSTSRIAQGYVLNLPKASPLD